MTSYLDPLQFAYRPRVGVEDAIIYLLHRAHSHLDKSGRTVRISFLIFQVLLTPYSQYCYVRSWS